MNCQRCGNEIPDYMIRGDSFDCPYCGLRYYRTSPEQCGQYQNPQYQQPYQQYTSASAEYRSVMPFRTARMVIGILSMILFIVVMVQSCGANVVNALSRNTTDTSASGGTIVAFALLVAGITSAVGRDNVKSTMVAGVIYIASALIGFRNYGTFVDLAVWSYAALAFGALNMYCWWQGKNPRWQ